MDGPNTLKRCNELLDYLQTNNAFRKSKFINYKFYDCTLLPPLSTIQQVVLDYLNEFIALQLVRDEYYKELTKPILLPQFSGEYLKINAQGSGYRAILLEVLTLRHNRNINKMLAVILYQELANLYTSYRTFEMQCISK